MVVYASITDLEVICNHYHTHIEARGSVVVKTLCYKSVGRGSRPDEVKEFFQVI
jgi:hypothetical protein